MECEAIETREHIVEEGTYIPDMGIEYSDTPDKPLINPPKIRKIDVEHDYRFLDRTFSGRMQNFLIYLGIFTLVYSLNRIKFGLKIEGRKNLRKNKALLKNGAMTIANHVLRWDFPTVLQAVGHKRIWFPARTSNFETKDAYMIKGAGGAFKMAYRYRLPIVPMAFSFRKPTGIWKLLGVKHPLVTIRIGEPIPIEKPEGVSRNEYCAMLRDKTHEAVCKLAGIKQNMWQSAGD